MTLFFALWFSGWAFVVYRTYCIDEQLFSKVFWIIVLTLAWPLPFYGFWLEMRWNQRLIVVMGIAAIVSVVMGWDK